LPPRKAQKGLLYNTGIKPVVQPVQTCLEPNQMLSAKMPARAQKEMTMKPTLLLVLFALLLAACQPALDNVSTPPTISRTAPTAKRD
jgi:hypothetical protein